MHVFVDGMLIRMYSKIMHIEDPNENVDLCYDKTKHIN